MAGATGKVPIDRPDSDGIVRYSDEIVRDSNEIFGFFEESYESSCNSGDSYGVAEDMDGDDDAENGNNVEEDRAFWESKDQLLQATLCRTSSVESKIRKDTREALRELTLAGTGCSCRRAVVDGCRNCLQREICDRLRRTGHNCVVCKSKWKSSPDIPSGEHSYLEVVDNSNSKKGEVRVIIELNFRAEFELARANEEYNRLVSRLPEVFVGKAERLHNLIKILCSAAKKCMKDKKMHMGPWRKQKYMQAKWFGPCERTSAMPICPPGISGQLPKPRASLLTFDLVESLPVFHRTAVQVV